MKPNQPRLMIILFLLLVSHPFIGSQLTTGALILAASWTTLRYHFKVPKQALLWMLPPGALLVLGMLGSSSHYPRDVLKDSWYYTFPMLAVFTGYLLARNRKNVESILLTFVVAGAVLSSWHLAEFITHRDLLQTGDLGELRDQIGSGFMLSSVSPMILYLASRSGVKLFDSQTRGIPLLIYAMTLASVACAFSRTMVISTLVSFVAGLGWLTTKNRRGMIVIGLLVVVLFGLNAVVPEDSSSFLGKFAQTREEISYADFGTAADAIHHWRAYETLMATATYLGGNDIQKAVGMGFGQLVDIGMDVELGGTVMHQIPIFHNGYVYVLVKTGYVGLAIFMIYLVRLYAFGARQVYKPDRKRQMLGGVLMAMISMVAVSTFVVSGWFNPNLICGITMLIGTLLSLLSGSEIDNEIAR